MKKIAVALVTLVVSAMAWGQTKISEISAKDLKKSGTKQFITDAESFKAYKESCAGLASDPFMTYFMNINANEKFLSAVEDCGDALSDEVDAFAIRVEEQGGQLENSYKTTGNGKVDFTINLPKKAFKSFAKMGLNIEVPVSAGLFSIKNSSDDESSAELLIDADYEAKLGIDTKKLLGKDAASSVIKDMQMAMGFVAKAELNVDKNFIDDSDSFDNFLKYVNSSNIDAKFVLYAGSSIDSGEFGGKCVIDFTIGYKGKLNAAVIEKLSATYAEFMKMCTGTEADMEVFKSSPLYMHIGYSFYDDKNNLTYVVADESDLYKCMVKFQDALATAGVIR
ncbi:hypothetical protein DYE49_10915 [Treponema rectale]|uniref:Uncharacterized protein n=1 Tax=Treponema rectale TaxID=744512 RepID=A0A840SEJ0_9SPIR|nr:hypothetical protein [Treponema rectale]MBB5219175.1 hypothetical protein [Treponema rectale]QOS40928.1 hypothetical protein DYE49_10915 [Treponema rectale]